MNGVILLAIALAGGPVYTLPGCTDGRYCGLDRPEDITLIPGSEWAVVSLSAAPDSLMLVHLPTGKTKPVEFPAGTVARVPEPDCWAKPQSLVAAGNAIGIVAGKTILAAINKASNGRVEFFEISQAADPVASWTGCTNIPKEYLLNDLAVHPDGTLYASHMFDPPRGAEGIEKLMNNFKAGSHTGFALSWTEHQGWSPVANTELSFANGIAVAPDGRTLAITGTYSKHMLLVTLATGVVNAVPLSIQPDNISVLTSGDFLTVGHTGVPVTGLAGCRKKTAFPCGFPFAVQQISLKGAVQTIFKHDGSRIPGASVAVVWGHTLLLGSAMGDRISEVTL